MLERERQSSFEINEKKPLLAGACARFPEREATATCRRMYRARFPLRVRQGILRQGYNCTTTMLQCEHRFYTTREAPFRSWSPCPLRIITAPQAADR